MLNRSAHTLRYRRFANLLTDADARLAVEVVVSLLPPVGLSPTTLHQLAWRTDRAASLPVGGVRGCRGRHRPVEAILTTRIGLGR